MSSKESSYSPEHLVGNTDVPRIQNPEIRGGNRRLDPDGSSSVPYFSGLAATSLDLDLSVAGTISISFTTDGYQDAIDEINAAAPSHLLALDNDGYLTIRNLNGGGKNYLKITGGDAAPVLGFDVDPLPGSVSYAGDLANAAPGRTSGEDNPQGTGLVAEDDDLKTSTLNRAVAAGLFHTARHVTKLDVEIPAVREFDVTVTTHTGSGKKVFIITDASLRVPVSGFDIGGSTPTARQLDSIVAIFGTDYEHIIDVAQSPPMAQVLDVYYNDGTNTTADNTGTFATWGTIDGLSIFGSSVPTKDKHSSTSIQSIRGNVIYVPGATFQTLKVQAGDTVVIENATNDAPFNHNGEFIVDEVLDEENVAVRPKSSYEPTFISTDKPSALNLEKTGVQSYGDLRVVIGNYVPASDGLMFEVPSWVSEGSYKARIVSGQKMRNLGIGDLVRSLTVSDGESARILRSHIALASAGFRHAAADLDAPAVAGSPNSLSAGTVEAQLSEILSHLNNLIAGEVTYSGGIDWVDGTTNPQTDLESQVDKILNDLAGAGIDGAAKIRAVDSGLLNAGSVRDQLDQLNVEWLKLNRANTVTGSNTFSNKQIFNGQSGDTNFALETTSAPTNRKAIWQWNNGSGLLTRLFASPSGIEFVHNASWDGADWTHDDDTKDASKFALTGGGLNFYRRAAAASTWTDSAWVETHNLALGLAQAFLLKFTNLDPSKARLYQEFDAASEKLLLIEAGDSSSTIQTVRVYIRNSATVTFGIEIAVNAKWDNDLSQWSKDNASVNAARLLVSYQGLILEIQDNDPDTWDDTSWSSTVIDGDIANGLTVSNLISNGDIDASGSSVSASSLTATGSVSGSLVSATSGVQVSDSNPGDDYITHFEEGNWTPELEVGGATKVVTVQNGRYVRFGRTVIAYGRIHDDNVSASSETVEVRGLPVNANTSGIAYAVSFADARGLGVNMERVVGFLGEGTTGDTFTLAFDDADTLFTFSGTNIRLDFCLIYDV